MASEFLNQVTNDPGHTSLRRGLRAAVVAPVLLALSSTLGLPQAFTIYLNFAALGLLVFLRERSRQTPAIDTWARLLSNGKGLLLIGDVLDWYADR